MPCYDWNLYLTFSEQILASCTFDEQTVARIAVSRAYYAAFHVAEDYLKANKYEIAQGAGSHDAVCKSYKEMNKGVKEFKSKCRSIGSMLVSLKERRVDSDYNAGVSLNKSFANKNCKFARKIIKEINELDNLKNASKAC